LRFFEKDLRLRIIASILLVTILSLAAISIVSYLITNRTLKKNIENTMLDFTGLARNSLEVAFERRTSRMQLLSNLPILRDPLSSLEEKQKTLSIFMDGWPIGLGALLVDTGGNVICGTGKLGGIGYVGNTTWFRNAETAQVVFTYIDNSQELSNMFLDSPVLAVSTPVKDANKQIFSYAVCFTSLSDIKKAIDGVSILDSGHAVLIGSNGSIMAGYLFSHRPKLTSEELIVLKTLSADILRSRYGNKVFTYCAKKYLITYAPVTRPSISATEIDWAVGVIVPSDEAYSPAHTLAIILEAFTAAIVLAATVVAILLGRSISSPITELASTAERIGSGDLTVEVAIRTRDQIGTLAATLLRMRDYLRAAISDATQSSERMLSVSEEQSAATRDLFENSEEIVNSVIVLTKNLETQVQKLREISDSTERMPAHVHEAPAFKEVKELISDIEILSEVGASKAVEIATASQDQRSAAKEIAQAAKRLSDQAKELKKLVERFKT